MTISFFEDTVWLVETGRGELFPRAGFEHHELQSFGRFRFQKMRDFLTPGWAAWRSALPNLLGGSRRRRFQPVKYTRNLERGHGEHGARSKVHEVSLSCS